MATKKITDLIQEKVIEPLQLEAKKRDEAKARLQRLNTALSESEVNRESLEGKLASVAGQRNKCLAEGKDASKLMKEAREIKADMVEMDALIQDLQSNAIPAAKTELANIENALRLKVQEKVREVKSEIRGLFEKAIQQADDVQGEWGQALGKLRESIIGVSDSPEELRTFLLLANKDSLIHALYRFVEGR